MTTASTTDRGPRGWERLVLQANSAMDLPSFHRTMLDMQCKIVAAEYGILWVADTGGKPKAIDYWPPQYAQIPADSPIMQMMTQAAQSGFERQSSHILKAEPETPTGGSEDLGAHVFVTPLRVRGQVVAVTTVVAECRDVQVLQSTAPLRDVASGLYEGFFARQESALKDAETSRVKQAMAILAVSQEAQGFQGAVMNLVNELARQFQCTRVSLSWVKGHAVKLVAMSDTEHLKRHSPEAVALELAMCECLDQQQPVVYPIPQGVEPLLQQAVVHMHRKFTNDQAGRNVLSLPLRCRDEWIGVLTLERTNQGFDPGLIQFLQLVVDVVAPHLQDRKDGDRWLVVHGWHSVKWATSYLIGPQHTAWKLGAIAIIAALAFILFGSWDYKVTAPFVFESRDKRVLPVPYEGRLKTVKVEPASLVKAGDILAELDSTELRLQLIESQAKHRAAEIENDKANADPTKMADALLARATMDQMKARIDLLQLQIDQSVIRASVDGTVLTGSWMDKIGSVIKQGEPLFEVAPLQDIMAVLHVNETDIDQFHEGEQYTGYLATRGEPTTTFTIEVWRIVPMATPKENVNGFTVRAKLSAGRDPRIMPGMEGLAKVEVGQRGIYWILTHRIADHIRLWIWSKT